MCPELVVIGQCTVPFSPFFLTRSRSTFCRNSLYEKWVNTINATEGGFDKFSKAYERYGLNVKQDGSNDIVYREWAPNAETAALIGDFSTSHLIDNHIAVDSLHLKLTSSFLQTTGTARATK